MDAVCFAGTPASRQASSKGSISAGSASSARITSSARPSRKAFFTCLMPTTFLDSQCSSTVGHPHVFARQDSRGHTHARMNYSRINEIRQLYCARKKENFQFFLQLQGFHPPRHNHQKHLRTFVHIPRIPAQKSLAEFCTPHPSRRVLRPQAQLLSTKKRAPRALSFSLMSYILSSSIISSVTTDSGVTPGSKSR